MRKTAACCTLMLIGCNSQPSVTLVMTTFAANGGATGITALEGFPSKEKCQSAGAQWRDSLGVPDWGRFVCLETKQ